MDFLYFKEKTLGVEGRLEWSFHRRGYGQWQKSSGTQKTLPSNSASASECLGIPSTVVN